MMDRRLFLAGSAALGGLIMTEGVGAKQRKPDFTMLDGAPRLQLRNLANKARPPVIYIHGGTFPSALSVGYQFADGLAWEDSLHDAGFDVWALDFEGYGGSARPAFFDQPESAAALPLRYSDAVKQIARAVKHIVKMTGYQQVSIIAHSWGGIPAARFATDFGKLVKTLVLFAPVVTRQPLKKAAPDKPTPKLPAWNLVTLNQQLTRFVADTPKGHPTVLAEPMLDLWGPKWLATDGKSGSHSPPAVKVPGGPTADFMEAWGGVDHYDSARLKGNILFVRGEWDSVSSAADAESFKARAKNAIVTISTIPKSGHLAHLETNRTRLWAEVNSFLKVAKP